jgi:hypothetical protein
VGCRQLCYIAWLTVCVMGFAIGTSPMLPAQGFCFSTLFAEWQTRIAEQAGELIHSAW